MIKEDFILTVIGDVAGQDVLPLIDVLKGKKNVSEFTLAEELKEEINTIRNKLYRLYDSNLVEFTRKKDKKKGWYIYYWTFVPGRVPRLLKDLTRKKLEKMKERIAYEQKEHFFECASKCIRLTFDKAIDYEFKCPECGDLMNQEDNAKKIESMLVEIEKLEKELATEREVLEEGPLIDMMDNFDDEVPTIVEEAPVNEVKKAEPIAKVEKKVAKKEAKPVKVSSKKESKPTKKVVSSKKPVKKSKK